MFGRILDSEKSLSRAADTPGTTIRPPQGGARSGQPPSPSTTARGSAGPELPLDGSAPLRISRPSLTPPRSVSLFVGSELRRLCRLLRLPVTSALSDTRSLSVSASVGSVMREIGGAAWRERGGQYG